MNLTRQEFWEVMSAMKWETEWRLIRSVLPQLKMTAKRFAFFERKIAMYKINCHEKRARRLAGLKWFTQV